MASAAVFVGFMAGVAVVSASPADPESPKSSTSSVSLAVDGPQTPDAERALLHLADASLEIDWVASEPQVVSPVSEVLAVCPTGRSLMPEGLLEGLSDDQLRDFFAFLSSSQPFSR